MYCSTAKKIWNACSMKSNKAEHFLEILQHILLYNSGESWKSAVCVWGLRDTLSVLSRVVEKYNCITLEIFNVLRQLWFDRSRNWFSFDSWSCLTNDFGGTIFNNTEVSDRQKCYRWFWDLLDFERLVKSEEINFSINPLKKWAIEMYVAFQNHSRPNGMCN